MRIVFLIFLLIFLYDSELFNIYVGATNVLILKVLSFGLLLIDLVKKKTVSTSREKIVIATLIAIHLYVTTITISYSGFDGLFWSFKFLMRFFIIIFLIRILEIPHFNMFIKWYKLLGLILAVQSVLLFALIYLNISIPRTYVTRHNTQDLFTSYGLLGFGNVNSGYSFRTQSFFSEATNFAKFLILPFFCYLNDFFVSRKRYTLLKMLIVLFAIGTTFSLTAILALLIGVVMYLLMRRKGAKNLLKYMPILLFLGYGLYAGVTTLIAKGVDKTKSSIISGSFQKGDASVGIREEYIYNVLDLISYNPLGIGYNIDAIMNFSALPLAPTRWLLYGGWIGLFGLIILHKNFLAGWYRALDHNLYKLFFVICATQFIISLIHGSWIEFIYWINFLILIKLLKWSKGENSIR